MKTITKEEYEYLVKNGCCFEGYVEDLGIAGSKNVVFQSDRPSFPNERTPGITRDTTFSSIEKIPVIIPLIPIESPRINHEILNALLKQAIEEPGFTPSTQVWVRKLEAEIAKKQSKNKEKIEEKQAKIVELTARGKHSRIAAIRNKILELEAKNTELDNIKREIRILATSNQIYEVVIDDSLSTPTHTRAGVDFDFTTGNIKIVLPSNANLQLFVHELKHAYQFEIGAYSIGRHLDDQRGFESYPNLLYDLQDEVEAYARGALFNGPSRTANSISREPEYKDLVNGPIDFRSIPNINNFISNSRALDQFAKGSGHAFRVNGITYYKRR